VSLVFFIAAMSHSKEGADRSPLTYTGCSPTFFQRLLTEPAKLAAFGNMGASQIGTHLRARHSVQRDSWLTAIGMLVANQTLHPNSFGKEVQECSDL